MDNKLLPGSLNSAQELLGKIRREAALLQEEVTSDRFLNFAITGYSLIDWIKNDPAVPTPAKSPSAVEGLYRDPWLALCGDVATAAKHFTLTKRLPIASEVVASKGYGRGRFSKGAFGRGEEQIEVRLSNGTVHDLFEIVEGALRTWEAFFTKPGMGKS